MSDLQEINTYSLRIEKLIEKTCEHCSFDRSEIVENPYNCICESFAIIGRLKSENFKQFRNKYGFIANRSMQELISQNFPFEDMLKDFSDL